MRACRLQDPTLEVNLQGRTCSHQRQHSFKEQTGSRLDLLNLEVYAAFLSGSDCGSVSVLHGMQAPT